MNTHLSKIYQNLSKKYNNQNEYLQAVFQFLKSIDSIYTSFPELEKLSILERFIETDRIISFKVPWVDDNGRVHVNKGYRVQFNQLIGPYKGGLRFDESVNESILKFLGFEQTLKNSLTTLPMGGAKGGSDFSPKGKSDFEIMRFCQSFITELYKYIGDDIDIPAGDLGVSGKEIGYMFGMYKKITGKHHGTLTGKGVSFGGINLRPEATGYGLCYITEKALNTYHNTSFKDKLVTISGSGNVALYAAYKSVALGGKVIAMSSTTGGLYDPNGLNIELIQTIKENKENLSKYLETFPNAEYFTNPKNIWSYKTDIVLPCATQNELDLEDAKLLAKNKVLIVAEGANMPSTNEAAEYFINNKIVYIPGKAANAGGVSVSGLEMSQNATFSNWTSVEVDNKLKEIMLNIFNNIYTTAIELNDPYNLEKGANISAFKKIYEAMKVQGI